MSKFIDEKAVRQFAKTELAKGTTESDVLQSVRIVVLDEIIKAARAEDVAAQKAKGE